jgi:ABC-type oligopeptide transport system ATPase subunit
LDYAPLCPREVATLPGISEIAAAVLAPIESAFVGYVLPHRTRDKPTFVRNEAKLYVDKRDWIAKYPVPERVSVVGRYETLLDGLFWDRGPFTLVGKSYHKKLLFLVGTIGCGKSTFADYYLRCHFPESTKVDNDFFDSLLIIHCDLKNRQNIPAVNDRIFTNTKSSLERAGVSTSFMPNVMNHPSDRAIRDVFKTLSDEIAAGKLGRKKYLVLVVDNIDQSPDESQAHCLTLCQDMLEEDSGINFWKIIFPLWPRTLSYLKRKSKLILKSTDFDEVELGHPNLGDFYRKKVKFLRERFKTSDQKTANQLLAEVTTLMDRRYRNFLRELTYGNFTSMDSLIVGLLLSKELMEHRRLSGVHEISDYRFFDSLITGKTNYYDRDNSVILNPFGWRDSESAQCVLVIPYLLSFFKKDAYNAKGDLISFFLNFQFPEHLLEDALYKMDEYNILHFEQEEAVARIHLRVVEAYKQLIRQPAVIDNFAITTPLPITIANHRNGWKLTRGYEVKDFEARVSTALLFLDAIKEQETLIDIDIENSHNPKATVNDFRKRIPYLSIGLKSAYRERLRKLREHGWPRGIEVSETFWDKALK